MDSALANPRPSHGPIRREGYPYIAGFAFLSLILFWIWPPLLFAGIVLTGGSVYAFRDPDRVTPNDPDGVMSAADGRVCAVGPAVPPAELQLGADRRLRISVAVGLVDCCVSRLPVAGRVVRIVHRPRRRRSPGPAFDRDSEDNERSGLVIETLGSAFGIMQIAGPWGQPLTALMNEGDEGAAGERFGLIRFFSRVDLYLPAGFEPAMREGQTAVAGETVLARRRRGA